jgi:hypothetical protein
MGERSEVVDMASRNANGAETLVLGTGLGQGERAEKGALTETEVLLTRLVSNKGGSETGRD